MTEVVDDGGRPRVAVVLSGAGARGAFQAGALSVLVPALEARGLRPTVWLGTSAGSINAALWGACAHLDAPAAAERTLAVWRAMGSADVYAPVPLSLGHALTQYAAGALVGRGTGTTSLLDTAPAAAHRAPAPRPPTARGQRGRRDARRGRGRRHPDALPGRRRRRGGRQRQEPALPRRARGGRVRRRPGARPRRGPRTRRGRARAGVLGDPGRLSPVRITTPESAAGWYTDGGVRLNTLLQPAVGLGATMIVLVSATSTSYRPPPRPARPARRPTSRMPPRRSSTRRWPTAPPRTSRACGASTGWWRRRRVPASRAR